jgi:hypothetical protein
MTTAAWIFTAIFLLLILLLWVTLGTPRRGRGDADEDE